ncbi:hypothetical protein [Microbulbifer agarilyticus]
MSEEKDIPAKFFHEREGESHVELDAFLNNGGLITIAIKDGAWIELSPLAVKELTARLNIASKDFAAELLSSS